MPTALALSLPNTLLLDPRALVEARTRLRANDRVVAAAGRILRHSADLAMKQPLASVVDKKAPAPSGDPRDYFSIGTYWWPNPDTPDGLPYVRRDGQINPESMESDTGRVRAMVQRCQHLALAYFFFGDERYGKRCAQQLRRWFLNARTGMNPHLRFSQCIPGVCEGRSFGVIDTRDFRYLVDAVALIQTAGIWSLDDDRELRSWMGTFLEWLLTSPLGRSEGRSANNHGTWYSAQVLSLALHVGDHVLARKLALQARDRIDQQITADGEQPEEFARSRPLTYCTMNLHAFCDAATLAESAGVDLWRYEGPGGGSLRKAWDWMKPYLQKSKPWPDREIIDYAPENYMDVFRRVSLVYGDKELEPRRLPIDENQVRKNLMQLMYPLPLPVNKVANSAVSEAQKKIAEHWDNIHKRGRIRWWHSPVLIKEINHRVCGKRLPRISQGMMTLAREVAGNRVFERGVSVGGGTGSKEMALLDFGLVEHMTVYELSSGRVASGQKAAAKRGLESRITFVEADAFEDDVADGAFDLVHWNNALHHMFDVDAALAWSQRVLREDGFLMMDDYVGPNRFQWSDETLAFATRIRQTLPKRYLRRNDGDEFLPQRVGRPSVKRIVAEDPSEAPDSARIIGALRTHFPGVAIIPTGGAVYNLALTHLLHNFEEKRPPDVGLMRALMLADDLALREPGVESHYAVALAWKDGRRIDVKAPELQEPAAQEAAPLWIRIARALLPPILRDGLNTANRMRLTAQARLRKGPRTKQVSPPTSNKAADSQTKPKSKTPDAQSTENSVTNEPRKARRRSRSKLAHGPDPRGRFYCPVCDQRVSGFVRGGAHGRKGAKCPSCGALERHRAAWIYYSEHAQWLDPEHGAVKLLHIAPDEAFEERFQSRSNIDYLSADIEPGRAMEVMDLTRIDKPDESFDVVICSHVLEHIPDDAKAMSEMFRILKPGGTAYIQIPLRKGDTYEDWSITSPDDRRKAFGQADHVRVYGPDIAKRLATAGFEAEIVVVRKMLPAESARRMNLGARQIIVARKVAAESS